MKRRLYKAPAYLTSFAPCVWYLFGFHLLNSAVPEDILHAFRAKKLVERFLTIVVAVRG